MNFRSPSSLPRDEVDTYSEPALEPPPGATSDFENPPNGNHVARVVLPAALAVVTLCVLVRAYSRICIVRRVRSEDSIIVEDYEILRITGFYVHQWHVRMVTMPSFSYTINHISIMYNLLVGSLKIAILLEWCHIFVPFPTRNSFFWTCWALVFVNAAYYFAGLMMGIFACVPREYIWNKSLPGGGHCMNSKVTDLSSAILNVVLDVAILLLPQRVIWKLAMPFHTKIGLSVIFAIGILCCVAAALRLYATYLWLNSTDSVYSSSLVLLMVIAEATCMFLILCVPAAPKIFDGSRGLARLLVSFSSWTRLSSRPQPSTTKRAPRQDIELRPTDERNVTRHTVQISGNRLFDSTQQLTILDDQPQTGILSTTQFLLRENRRSKQAGEQGY
ncbi:hypothetical protein F4780DRAFT_770758 [Xylariomycetidae sp. FL0641]|nr:hypothetical protein F4780DRAFT_770758 [Xylariomycetidae sp. FL0641]